jgi:hypothetical protein
MAWPCARLARHVAARPWAAPVSPCRRWASGSAVDPETRGTTHFGYQTVDETRKAEMVGSVFRRVAERWALLNWALSFRR